MSQYGSIRAIYAEAKQNWDIWLQTPRRDCPIDGTTLMEDHEGILTCRFDGYQYKGDPRYIYTSAPQ